MIDVRFLNPSKRMALAVAITWLTVSVLFFSVNWGFCGGVFLVVMAYYGIVWVVKMRRDQQLAEQAAEARPLDEPRRSVKTPPMSSRESAGLFVPPALDQ